jgi:hypothetical protein
LTGVFLRVALVVAEADLGGRPRRGLTPGAFTMRFVVDVDLGLAIASSPLIQW